MEQQKQAQTTKPVPKFFRTTERKPEITDSGEVKRNTGLAMLGDPLKWYVAKHEKFQDEQVIGALEIDATVDPALKNLPYMVQLASMKTVCTNVKTLIASLLKQGNDSAEIVDLLNQRFGRAGTILAEVSFNAGGLIWTTVFRTKNLETVIKSGDQTRIRETISTLEIGIDKGVKPTEAQKDEAKLALIELRKALA